VCRQLILRSYLEVAIQWRRPGAEFGGTDKIFRCPTFLNDVFFRKNIFTFRVKISDFFSFLVIDLVFRIFPFFSQIFRIFTMLNVVYDPFLTRKTTLFYSVHTFTRIRQHYFSKYWGRTNAWAVPHLTFWGTVPPVPPPRSTPDVMIENCLFGKNEALLGWFYIQAETFLSRYS